MSERPKVTVIVPIEDHLDKKIRAACEVTHIDIETPRPQLLTAMGDCDGVLLTPRVRADAEFFDAASKLRVLSTTSVGYDPFDIDEATRHGVCVCHTPRVLTTAVTNLTMTSIFALSLKLFEYERFVRDGKWAAEETPPSLGNDIANKTLGVVGFGRIGQAVTERMQGLGMKTLWYDRFDEAPPGAPTSAYRPLKELMAESDFVSVHANLDESSHHLIGAAELACMKPTAFFINTARGGLVDQDALRSTLERQAIAGAALDVLEQEPPDPNDPITGFSNVICFPHIGTATEETRLAMRELAVDNLLAVLAGNRPPAPVNPEVLSVAQS